MTEKRDAHVKIEPVLLAVTVTVAVVLRENYVV